MPRSMPGMPLPARSDKPADADGTRYAKRTMAADVVALARALGHERFALAGHDRGALVAVRAGLDHPRAVTSIVADYRASAGIDVTDDTADRAAGNRLAMPVTVLQQDWGTALGYDAAGLWGADLEHRTVTSGHFMAEEAPAEVVAALRALLAR
ncbi:alpha/beta fold hydrolase [Micromonospora sp. NPDC001898]|uniref:alpha/beta fold hydrolase n=1 Tax=Micromonospora sp. NPDC001898 TaxID=3364221 RepID=UPI0036AE8C16